MITREQRIAGYKALRAAGVDPAKIDEAMAAEGLTAAESPAKAAARARLDNLIQDREFFRRLLAGDAGATTEFESLNRQLAD